ncbi:hypothetical protein MY04_1853 [Flammeovirga sp. MY04]|uniref:CheR family methyltransferase n=1 Tax=Flammeovirga sp. MY04 TaxID=1191459 RepID=UPI0008063158|nr:CheR family methyltransferase [Flammeovirga sp. MY04]ANQ49227.1 hypothetical protein MY04_1853 [Flammeovirga sp. MY04]
MTENNYPKFVVGIGASAGGLEAINNLFEKLNNNTDMCFIVVLHLSIEHKSLIPELLRKVTKIPIIEVNKDHFLKKNHIYLINNHTTLSIENNKIVVKEKNSKRDKLSYPINILFKSLATTYKEKAIGIILSGTGSDGTEGLRYINANNGISIVQHPDSAKFNGMPFSAIQTNPIDFISSIEDLSQILEFISTNGNSNRAGKGFKVLDHIISLVSSKSNINFGSYKTQTLYRRILKMMEYQNFNSIEKYYQHLTTHPKELDSLANSFLIGVTSFFRDLEEWDFVEQSIIPKVFKDKDIVRIWSLGCSTGQEAYTLAILVLEELEKIKEEKEVKIFATDLNNKAIQYASEGSFTEKELNEIPTKFLKKYFFKNGNKYTVNENVRQLITFVKHDILETPPFLNIDLITCRNLLIYFKKENQYKILNTIKFSLNKGGYLFLGPSEKNFSDKFLKEIDVKKKFFQLTENFKIIDIDQRHKFENQKTLSPVELEITQFKENIFATDIEKRLIQFFCQPFIVVDFDENIIYSTKETGKYLFFPQKELVLKEVFDFEVYIDIIREIKKVKEDGKSRKLKNISFNNVTEGLVSDIIIRKFTLNIDSDNIILEFVPIKKDNQDNILEQDNTIQNLKDEIKHLHLELKNANKKIEGINENYQINNEELMSSNEELQSSNEELQSVNEELYTVNQEYKEKLTEISVLNNDFLNLFKSAGIASLYLDNDLKIRRIAPNASDFFGIENEDLGRSILQFNTFFKIKGSFYQSIEDAVKVNQIQEQEISDNEGKKYLLRVSPCVNKDFEADGVILSFIPISDFNPTKKLLALNEEHQEKISQYKTISKHLDLHSWTWLFDEKKVLISGKEYNNISAENFDSFIKNKYGETVQNESYLSFRNKLNDCIQYGKEFKTNIHLETKVILIDCSSINKNHKIVGLHGILKDITEEYKKEKEIGNLANTYLDLLDLDHFGTISIPDIKKDAVNVNDTLLKWLEIQDKNITIDKSFILNIIQKEDEKKLYQLLKEKPKQFDITLRINTLNSEKLHLRLAGKITKEDNHFSLLCLVFDISETKSMEYQWKETVNLAEKTAQTLAVQNEQLESYTYIASHNIRSPLSNLLSLVELYHNENDDKEKEKYIQLFEKALAQLEKTVNNLTDAIKVQQKTSLQRSNINIKEELMKVLDILSGNMKKHGVLISMDVERGLTFSYPEEYLRSIFLNLLSNAIKYRSEDRLPKIEVEVYSENNQIVISVKDNGMGIDLEKFGQRIFGMNQTFHHNEDARGLGLFLTKTQVEATGGTIQVDSKVNVGTKFTIKLPNDN